MGVCDEGMGRRSATRAGQSMRHEPEPHRAVVAGARVRMRARAAAPARLVVTISREGSHYRGRWEVFDVAGLVRRPDIPPAGVAALPDCYKPRSRGRLGVRRRI